MGRRGEDVGRGVRRGEDVGGGVRMGRRGEDGEEG